MRVMLTRADRQKIIDEFTSRHDGWYDPKAFLREVHATKGQHQAWGWFTWEDEKAAEDHRIWQARKFAGGLIVTFAVETIKRGVVTVHQEDAPAMFSPIEGRAFGGGYQSLDPNDSDQMAAFCAEAARSLQSWLRRYSGAVAYSGGSVAGIKKQAATLDNVSAAMSSEAA